MLHMRFWRYETTCIAWCVLCLHVVLLLNLTVGTDALSKRGVAKAAIAKSRNRVLEKMGNSNAKFTEHPMLFFSEEHLSKMRSDAKSTHLKYARKLKSAMDDFQQNKTKWFPPQTYEKFSSRWNELYGNVLPPMALYTTLNPDDDGAFQYVLDFMDQMEKYKKWDVASSPKDDVPLAHHVTGFAIALDMIYPRLKKKRRSKYVTKLKAMTKELYDAGTKRNWGVDQHLQNHVATNVIGIFIGGLVLAVHDKEAVMWQRFAVARWEASMAILRRIPDGSLDEGVGYVGYTFRSMCQYIFLVKRHYDYDHSRHTAWLARHFDYNYYTIIPGFQGSVGIADSPRGWFYGPEAQLIFLDTYVLRDGRGNWLASHIEKNRHKVHPDVKRPASQVYTTSHLDFLFYNSSLGEHPPQGYNQAELHHFTDWGVATYRTGSISEQTESYLSFKSAKIHGRAVYDMVRSKTKYAKNGWKNFNAGHEHPDQNSFTFWPNGELFISDGLYASKLPYLDNVLMFAPSSETKCTKPWAGQLGACGKWLNYKEKVNYGKIVMAKAQDNYVFMAGEAVHAYSTALHLKSVYRAVILLEKDLLVVVDYIATDMRSKLTHASAYFQNYDKKFQSVSYSKRLHGFGLQLPSGWHRAVWATEKGQSNPVTITPRTGTMYAANGSFANATFHLEGAHTKVAYIFNGPESHLEDFSFLNAEEQNAVLRVQTSKDQYVLKLNFSHSIRKDLLEIVANTDKRRTVFSLGRKTESQLEPESSDSSLKSIYIAFIFLLILLFYKKRSRVKRHLLLVPYTISKNCTICSVFT